MKKYVYRYLRASIKRLSLDIRMRNVIQNSSIRALIDILLLPVALFNTVIIKINSLTSQKEYKYNLAVVLIVKNEAKYISEWIEYYNLIGFNHIYIYDNDSSDDIKSVLKKYVENGFVTYKYMGGLKRQYDAYNDALNQYGHKCKYMAFFDADEFLYCQEGLLDFLDRNLIGKRAGLVVNWMVYGSSGQKQYTNKLVIDRFKRHSIPNNPKNLHTKIIVKPKYVIGIMNPHFAIFLPKYYSVNENLQAENGPLTKVYSGNKFRLNHYFTKSWNEFQEKKNRGKADSSNVRTDQEFNEHDLNDIYDNSMDRYVQLIYENLKEK